MKHALHLLVLIAAGAAGAGVSMPAAAGTVYRCDGADGSRSYASSPVRGSRCTSVAGYSDAPARAAAPAKAAPAAQASEPRMVAA